MRQKTRLSLAGWQSATERYCLELHSYVYGSTGVANLGNLRSKGASMKQEGERLDALTTVATNLLLKHEAVQSCPNHEVVLLDNSDAAAVTSAKREGRHLAHKKQIMSSMSEITAMIDDVMRDCPLDCPDCEGENDFV